MEQNQLKILKIRGLIQSLCIVLTAVLIQMACAFLWGMLAMHHLVDSDSGLMLLSVVSAFLMILWCCFFYYRRGWGVLDYRKICSGRTVISILGLGMGGCIVVALLLSLLQAAFPAAFSGYAKMMEQFGQGNMVITMLYTILLGPIMEELVFRGAVLDRLRSGTFPFWIANLIQAALFGVYHMNLIQGIYAFLWGILLGMVYQASGSVLANMLAHMVFNATNYLLGMLFPTGKAVFIPLYLGIFLFGIICFAAGLWYTVQEIKKERND